MYKYSYTTTPSDLSARSNQGNCDSRKDVKPFLQATNQLPHNPTLENLFFFQQLFSTLSQRLPGSHKPVFANAALPNTPIINE